MKISQHFLDSMSHTAVVRKWGLSDFAEMVSLRREDWHWIQVLSQRAHKFHAPLCFLAPPLHSSGQTRDRSNAHQMAACHIENQSLKSIFRHVIFFFFSSRCTIKSNKNSEIQAIHFRHISCCQCPEEPVGGRTAS